MKEKINIILVVPGIILIIIGLINLIFSIHMTDTFISVVCSIIGLFIFALSKPNYESNEKV